tara:strand:+ start:12023 stop:12679 length:657 start_codon:yes stop_codon:yes gene_type:complete
MIEEQFILRAQSYIQGNEGYKNYVYEDSRGYLSMGYGHKLTKEEKKKYKLGDRVNEKLLEDYWEKDWKIHYNAAKTIEGYDKLTLQQKLALVDLTFNMGVNWVKKFPNLIKNVSKASTALDDSQKQLYISNAANELKYKDYEKNDLTLSEYWGQVGNRALRNFQLLSDDYDDWDDYADPIISDEDDELEEVFQATEERYSGMFGNEITGQSIDNINRP